MKDNNTNVIIREFAKPALAQASESQECTQVELLTRILIGFAMLPKTERYVILLLGQQGENLLRLGATMEIGGKFSLPDNIKDLLNE